MKRTTLDGRRAQGADEAAWHVYVARCADSSLYTGIARDVDARIAAHNAGRGAKYTRSRLPVVLVYAEPAADRGAALRREHEIRRLSAADKRRLVAGAGQTSARSIKTM